MPHLEGIERGYQHQPDAVLLQHNPVMGTYYPILDAKNQRIIGISVSLSGALDETYQVRVTIDGQVFTSAETSVFAGTTYYIYWEILEYGSRPALSDTKYPAYRSFLFEGRSVKVELRKTTNAGNGDLEGCVCHAKY